jgi:hypothetical protein
VELYLHSSNTPSWSGAYLSKEAKCMKAAAEEAYAEQSCKKPVQQNFRQTDKRPVAGSCEQGNELSGSMKSGEFLD